MGRVERTYARFLNYALRVANPIKKTFICTECELHTFINNQALEILKNDGFYDAYIFFSDNISQINEGSIWADQDFKSSGHFYNPEKDRGLYGNTNALSLANGYYKDSLIHWNGNMMDEAMFYLGAAVHLVQDMTVPQHANIRLLDDHRQFENFVKSIYKFTPEFKAYRGGYYLDSIEEYIRCNARNAMKIYERLKYIKDSKKRYYVTTKFTLPLAQKTTAGCFMGFYRDIMKLK